MILCRPLWKSDIRNGGISANYSGSSDSFKIVLGLTCKTLGCSTQASRIASTAPLNISQFLNISEPNYAVNQSHNISNNQSSLFNVTNVRKAMSMNLENITVVRLCTGTTQPTTQSRPTTMSATGITQSPTTMSDTGTTQLRSTTMSDTGTTQSRPTTMSVTGTIDSYEASTIEHLQSVQSTVSNIVSS